MLIKNNKQYGKLIKGGKRYDKLYHNNKIYGHEVIANPGVERSDFESYLTNAFYAADCNIVGGGAKVNGAIVASFPDALSSKVVPYVGATSPSLGRPYYFNGAVVFRNESNTHFEGYDQGQGQGGPYTNPQELTLVCRMLPGQSFEALSNDLYIGVGSPNDEMRVISPSGWVTGSQAPEFFKMAVIHIHFNQSGSTRTAKLWVNGVYQGQKSTTSDGWSRTLYRIGVDTNGVDHDLYAKFYKQGQMSDAERAVYLEKLNTYFGAGQGPAIDQPYAKNITVSKSGNNYTCNYTYEGFYPENTSAVQYQWYELENNGAFTHIPLGTTKTINYTGSRDIRPTVKVTDNQGNSWRFINYNGWYNT